MKRLQILIIICSLLPIKLMFGQAPAIINVQGVLTDANSMLVPNGNYTLTFRLYGTSQDPTVLWTEKQVDLAVQSGVFNASLGKINPLNIPFDKPYFLSIQLGQEAEMSPRIEMTSTPYSMMAKNVENNSITTQKIQNNAITLDKIAPPIISSINGLINDGGDIKLNAGKNITVTPNLNDKSLLIAVSGLDSVSNDNRYVNENQANSISQGMIIDNAISIEKIIPNLVSSINNVTNDGGNINLVAGANISILNNNTEKTITISSVNPGITKVNAGKGISIAGSDGPVTVVSINPNSITDAEIADKSLTSISLANNAVGNSELQSNAVTIDKILPNIVSSLNGIANDGGNINLVAGNNISLVPNDANKTITISAIGIGGGTGNISQLAEGNNILIQNPFGPIPVISLKPNVRLGPNGSLDILNGNSLSVLALDVNNNNGGFLGIRNQDATEVFRLSTLDNRQPRLRLNNRLSNPVLDLIANDFSDGELKLYSVLTNPTVRISANEFTGGLINVFNPFGIVGVQIGTDDTHDGSLFLNSASNIRVLDLETNSGGGGIFRVYNQIGTESVRLTTSATLGGVVSVKNLFGNTAVNMSTNNFGDGGLFIDSGNDIPIIGLQAADSGGGYFEVNNDEGTEIVRIQALNDRQPQLRLRNRLANQVAELTANQFSDGELTLNSVLTNPTLRLTANDNAGGLFDMFNRNGTLTSRLTEDGGGVFSIFNIDQTEMIQLSTLGDMNARIRVNNRLGNPVADLISNDFSDGQLTLYSVLANPTVRTQANDNAGGQVDIFNRSGTLSARLSEEMGYGRALILDPLENILAAMQVNSLTNFGSLEIYGVDADNFIRGRLSGDEFSNGELKLFNKRKNPIVTLSGNANSDGQLRVFDLNGRNMSELSKDSVSLGGKLTVFNKDAKTSAKLLAGFNGSGLLQLFNNKNNLSAGFLADDNGGKLFIGDGGPFQSPRVDLSNTTTGGQLLLYSDSTRLMHKMSIKSNGEGLFEIKSKRNYPKNAVELGGDDLSNGQFSLFNSKGFKTLFFGHNAFYDGTIEIKNNLGNLGGYFTAYRDGGSLVISDGLPGLNHRAALEAGLFGGKLSIYNKESRLIDELGIAENGEGLLRIIHKQDLTKSRLELGGDNAGAGFQKFFNGSAIKTTEIGANSNGQGFISTFSETGKKQTFISPSGTEGGSVAIMDNKEVAVGTMSFDGYGGSVWVTNNERKGGAYLAHNTRGGNIFVRNNSDKIGVELSIASNLGGEFNIFNLNGVNTSKISNSASGAGMMEIGTSTGDKVARMTTLDGSGYIGLDNVDKKEVVRITANAGKGGGIGLKNAALADIINLTQDNSYGSILVNNPTGGQIATITHATNGAGFIGNKDHKGGNAVWILGNEKGGGNIISFNDLGKNAVVITQDGTSQGIVSVKGSAGNEIATMTGTTTGSGLFSINNSTGINLAGMTNNSSNGSGYLFAKNSAGREIARMTGTGSGNGAVTIDNSSGTTLAGITMGTASGGGYLFVNNSGGNDVARMSSLAGGAGYVSVDNNLAASVSYLTTSTINGGYIGVADSKSNDRARLTTTSNGAGFISNSNAAGTSVVELTSTANNHGTVETSNASGKVITGLLATSSGHGFVRVSNSAGNERAFMGSGDFGGTVAVKDLSGNQRVIMSGSGYMEVVDANGAYMNAGSTGTGVKLIFVDNQQHPRAEVRGGSITVKGPNGIDHSFMASASAPNFGYIGICNSNIVNSPVRAGMFVNASNQGILFADVKNFKMDYPGQPDKQIWYGSLEGPELAAYIRGTGKLEGGKAIIEFSDHYRKVANTGTMTVILTPLSGKSKGLAVVSKSKEGFEVEELLEGTGSYDFDWEVKCVRNGYEDFEPVRNKEDEPKLILDDGGNSKELKKNTSEIQVDNTIREKIIKN